MPLAPIRTENLGRAHDPETHLIPNVLYCALGRIPVVRIFGHGYPTRDGTCVRDYIHVWDLCRAHLAAMSHLDDHDGARAINLGNGQGFTVMEVIDAAREVTGCRINTEIGPPREGDSPVLVADSALAEKLLGWIPDYRGIHGDNRIGLAMACERYILKT